MDAIAVVSDFYKNFKVQGVFYTKKAAIECAERLAQRNGLKRFVDRGFIRDFWDTGTKGGELFMWLDDTTIGESVLDAMVGE